MVKGWIPKFGISAFLTAGSTNLLSSKNLARIAGLRPQFLRSNKKFSCAADLRFQSTALAGQHLTDCAQTRWWNLLTAILAGGQKPNQHQVSALTLDSRPPQME